jgi:uncharacterized DUF497 family protein
LRRQDEALEFEWDPEKERDNIKNHGVSFYTAIQTWRDPIRIERYDVQHSDYEDRWHTVGMYKRILTVVFTLRGDKIHIISAWKASPGERRAYHGASDLHIGHWYRANG